MPCLAVSQRRPRRPAQHGSPGALQRPTRVANRVRDSRIGTSAALIHETWRVNATRRSRSTRAPETAPASARRTRSSRGSPGHSWVCRSAPQRCPPGQDESTGSDAAPLRRSMLRRSMLRVMRLRPYAISAASRLCALHNKRTLAGSLVPPRPTGITWSYSSQARHSHRWPSGPLQVQRPPSRAWTIRRTSLGM